MPRIVGQDESGRLVAARGDELGDDARYEADDDGPDNAHIVQSSC